MDLVECVCSVSVNTNGLPKTIELEERLTGEMLAGFIFALLACSNGDMRKARNTYRLYDQQGLVYDLSLLYDQISDSLLETNKWYTVSVNGEIAYVDNETFITGMRKFYELSGVPEHTTISCG